MREMDYCSHSESSANISDDTQAAQDQTTENISQTISVQIQYTGCAVCCWWCHFSFADSKNVNFNGISTNYSPNEIHMSL